MEKWIKLKGKKIMKLKCNANFIDGNNRKFCEKEEKLIFTIKKNNNNNKYNNKRMCKFLFMQAKFKNTIK